MEDKWYVVHYGQCISGPFQTQELAEQALHGASLSHFDPEGLAVVCGLENRSPSCTGGVLPPWSGDWR